MVICAKTPAQSWGMPTLPRKSLLRKETTVLNSREAIEQREPEGGPGLGYLTRSRSLKRGWVRGCEVLRSCTEKTHGDLLSHSFQHWTNIYETFTVWQAWCWGQDELNSLGYPSSEAAGAGREADTNQTNMHIQCDDEFCQVPCKKGAGALTAHSRATGPGLQVGEVGEKNAEIINSK